MEPIVKYHFDREMVAFVKTLELKPAMFGYEKNDVFNKFKDLLVKARDVCEELVAAEHRKLTAFREAVARVKDAPDALNALLVDWESDSDGEVDEADIGETDRVTAEGLEEPQEDSPPALLSEEMDSEVSPSGPEDPELLRLQEENASLRIELADYTALIAKKDSEWISFESELSQLRDENTSLLAQLAENAERQEEESALELLRLQEENTALQIQVADYTARFDQLDSETQTDDSLELDRLKEENIALQIQVADYTALIDQLADGARPDSQELSHLREENAALRDQLAEYAGREELLQKAHAIVTEAELEKVQIVRSAQVEAEQELFLYRAKRRDEEEAFRKEMLELEARRQELVEAKERYQSLVMDGDQLFEQLKVYAKRLSNVQAEGSGELDGGIFDPPVLTVDEVHSCTEEAMPLCEIAEEEPERIFAEPDYTAVPQDNHPQEGDHHAGCGDPH